MKLEPPTARGPEGGVVFGFLVGGGKISETFPP